MSREEYQIPTAASSQLQAGTGAGGLTGGSSGLLGGSALAPIGNPILYSCGDCGYKFDLKRSEPIRCTECGCRVLYKNRTNRMIEFEAR